MRDTIKALIMTSAIIVAILVTGCVQNSGSATNYSIGNQASPMGTTSAISGQTSGQMPNAGTPPAGLPGQYQRQRTLPNSTVLNQAAEKLGVTEQQLENALNSSTGVRQNLTVAAQQLDVTPQQLADALGIPQGAQIQRGVHNSTTNSSRP
jgi:ABC-type phosphate/phosphonate transport system substrate-binding protein